MASERPIRCPTCGRIRKRSNAANARYWALLHVMSERLRPAGKAYSAETWHLWAKQKFLGCDETRLPDGKTLNVPRSTAQLDAAEFSDYMTAVEAFANDRGAFLEDLPA